MTANQLAFHANQERIRSNKAQEYENLRSNIAREQHNKNVLKTNVSQFNRSNWHSGIRNVTQGVTSLAKLFI